MPHTSQRIAADASAHNLLSRIHTARALLSPRRKWRIVETSSGSTSAWETADMDVDVVWLYGGEISDPLNNKKVRVLGS